MATLNVVADIGGGGATGLSRGYLVAAGVMAAMLALSASVAKRHPTA